MALVAVCTFVSPARAQMPITVSLDTVFYGDNAEFFSPFRTGETILGSWQRLNTDIVISDRATLRLGLYALELDGSDHRTELARPVASLTLGTKRHRFIIGTLDTGIRQAGIGPDQMTSHAMLPMLSTETLWFRKAYEAGVQWKTNTEHVTQDVWFDYQDIITPDHRELFDAGFTGRLQKSPTAPIALLYQFEVVHHGGQQFDVGPVSDSFGYGPGVLLRKTLPTVGAASFELFALFSHDRPDRQDDSLTVKGKGVFARAAAERDGWRGHAIFWNSRNFKHEEGDPNYLSLAYDATTYRAQRSYGELGLTKLFKPAPTVDFEASGRAHVVQGKLGYSYRLMGILHLDLWHSTTK